MNLQGGIIRLEAWAREELAAQRVHAALEHQLERRNRLAQLRHDGLERVRGRRTSRPEQLGQVVDRDACGPGCDERREGLALLGRARRDVDTVVAHHANGPQHVDPHRRDTRAPRRRCSTIGLCVTRALEGVLPNG